MANRLNWSMGHEGKGNVYLDGSISTWDIDHNSDPHHPEVADREGSGPPVFLFYITPEGGIHDGGITFNNQTMKDDAVVIADIERADRNLWDASDEEVELDGSITPRELGPEGYGHAQQFLSSKATHYNGWTGLPCNCPWGTKPVRMRRSAGQHLNQAINNAKKDKAYDTPEAAWFLDRLKALPEEHDRLMPFFASRFKHGDIATSGDDIRFRAIHHYDPNKQNLSDWKEGYSRDMYWPKLVDRLPEIQQWFNARNHPTRQGINLMDPNFTMANMHTQVLSHQEALREKERKKELLKIMNDPDHAPVDHEFPNGWTVNKLESRDAVEHEGEAMGHCIGAYDQPYLDCNDEGSIDIFSLRDEDGWPHGTWHTNNHEGGVAEIHGRDNGGLTDDYHEMYEEWCNRRGMSPVTVGHLEGGGEDTEYVVPGAYDTETFIRNHGEDGAYMEDAYADPDANIGENTEVYPDAPDVGSVLHDYLQSGPQYGDTHDKFYEAILNSQQLPAFGDQFKAVDPESYYGWEGDEDFNESYGLMEQFLQKHTNPLTGQAEQPRWVTRQDGSYGYETAMDRYNQQIPGLENVASADEVEVSGHRDDNHDEDRERYGEHEPKVAGGDMGIELSTWLQSFGNPQEPISPHHSDPSQIIPTPRPPVAQGPHIDPPSHPYEPYDWAAENDYTSKTANGERLYHVAPAAAHESIMQHGLNHSMNTDWRSQQPEDRPQGNYLVSHPQDAEDNADPWEDHIYAVDASGLNLQEDPIGDWNGYGKSYYTPDPIGPERIEHIPVGDDDMWHMSADINYPDNEPGREHMPPDWVHKQNRIQQLYDEALEKVGPRRKLPLVEMTKDDLIHKLELLGLPDQDIYDIATRWHNEIMDTPYPEPHDTPGYVWDDQPQLPERVPEDLQNNWQLEEDRRDITGQPDEWYYHDPELYDFAEQGLDPDAPEQEPDVGQWYVPPGWQTTPQETQALIYQKMRDHVQAIRGGQHPNDAKTYFDRALGQMKLPPDRHQQALQEFGQFAQRVMDEPQEGQTFPPEWTASIKRIANIITTKKKIDWTKWRDHRKWDFDPEFEAFGHVLKEALPNTQYGNALAPMFFKWYKQGLISPDRPYLEEYLDSRRRMKQYEDAGDQAQYKWERERLRDIHLPRMKRDHRDWTMPTFEDRHGDERGISDVAADIIAAAKWRKREGRPLGNLNRYDPKGMGRVLDDHQVSQARNFGKLVHTFKNGYTVKKLQNAKEAEYEGDQLDNCVGDYGDDVDHGYKHIYSLRDRSNKPHVVWEVEDPTDPDKHHGGTVQEIYGKGNTDPHDNYKAALKEFFTSIPLANRPSGDTNHVVASHTDIGGGDVDDYGLPSTPNYRWDGIVQSAFDTGPNGEPEMGYKPAIADKILHAAKQGGLLEQRSLFHNVNSLVEPYAQILPQLQQEGAHQGVMNTGYLQTLLHLQQAQPSGDLGVFRDEDADLTRYTHADVPHLGVNGHPCTCRWGKHRPAYQEHHGLQCLASTEPEYAVCPKGHKVLPHQSDLTGQQIACPHCAEYYPRDKMVTNQTNNLFDPDPYRRTACFECGIDHKSDEPCPPDPNLTQWHDIEADWYDAVNDMDGSPTEYPKQWRPLHDESTPSVKHAAKAWNL